MELDSMTCPPTDPPPEMDISIEMENQVYESSRLQTPYVSASCNYPEPVASCKPQSSKSESKTDNPTIYSQPNMLQSRGELNDTDLVTVHVHVYDNTITCV